MIRKKMINTPVSLMLASSIFLASCVSTTIIQSNPSGAKVYLNGEPAGVTPYTHQDTKLVGSTTILKLEKEGYVPFNSAFTRNEEVDLGAVIGGVLVWVPFLWTMKYKPTHTYDLIPLNGVEQLYNRSNSQNGEVKSKADRLRELKQLLDEKVITQEEYDTEKKKILDENR